MGHGTGKQHKGVTLFYRGILINARAILIVASLIFMTLFIIGCDDGGPNYPYVYTESDLEFSRGEGYDEGYEKGLEEGRFYGYDEGREEGYYTGYDDCQYGYGFEARGDLYA